MGVVCDCKALYPLSESSNYKELVRVDQNTQNQYLTLAFEVNM